MPAESELHYLLGRAKLFLMPSLYEGFGLPPLEAMKVGCPVVAADTASLPEILGNAALYFSPRESGGLIRAVDKIISQPKEADRLIALGKTRITKFSWRNMAIQTKKLYNTNNVKK